MPQVLDWRMPPDWEKLDALRAECTAFLLPVVGAEVSGAIEMVASELAENAVKYGSFQPDEPGEVRVRLQVTASAVTVEVSNPVSGAEAAQIAQLDRTIQWIRGYQDPFQAYLERMREVSGDSLQSTDSRLGLVRIAYEGRSALDFFVGDGSILHVSATYRR